jgi:hypothetical protein
MGEMRRGRAMSRLSYEEEGDRGGLKEGRFDGATARGREREKGREERSRERIPII